MLQGADLVESEGGVKVAVKTGRPDLGSIVRHAAKGMTAADHCIVCASGMSSSPTDGQWQLQTLSPK